MSIEVKHITKKFGEQKALNDVTFNIPSGQVVGFLGPNGAGKSTMMKVITGFIKPTSGEVMINGISTNNPRIDFRKSIGYLPENNPLYTDMFVKEYLCFVAKVYGLGEIGPKRVKELIELTGINHEQNKKIGQLSRGYRQRVGLAQALLNRPSVLILDEPTSGLDPNQIVEIRQLIANVGKEKTVMLSTHIMQEVEAICSRVIIINNGILVADDTTSKVMLHNMGSVQDILIELADEVNDDVFRAIPNILKVTRVERKTWLLSSKSEDDIRPEVFRFCVDKGYTILTLKQKSKQMEEVFQTLTQINS
jgi:ABC-2 type transport system ATP-binding protein